MAGQPFTGVGYLKFAFVNAGGSTTYWSHDGTSLAGSEPTGELSVQVRGGLYSILLGNDAIAGMAPIDLSLFQQYNDVHIRIWFNDGERGFQHLRPDRPFASVPYALSAGTAGSAGIAPGSISLNMLGSDVQLSLSSTIDRSRLSADVRADLNKTIVITRDMLPADVRNDLNRTITLSDLAPAGLLENPTFLAARAVAEEGVRLANEAQRARDAGDEAAFQKKGAVAKAKLDTAFERIADWLLEIQDLYPNDRQVAQVEREIQRWDRARKKVRVVR